MSSSNTVTFLHNYNAFMPIDPEKGFHAGTVVSSVLGILAQSVYACLILPSLPYMIQVYFPGVSKDMVFITSRST